MRNLVAPNHLLPLMNIAYDNIYKKCGKEASDSTFFSSLYSTNDFDGDPAVDEINRLLDSSRAEAFNSAIR
jgi:hypothetical protein